MQAVITVVDTLFDAVLAFSLRVLRAYIYADEGLYLREREDVTDEVVKQLPSPIAHKAITPPVSRVVSEPVRVSTARGMVMYAGIAQVPLYKNPTIEYDGQLATIPFGAMVMAGEPKGRFYHVVWNALSGWVLREDLADRATHIYPAFEKGVENGVDARNTACVRTLIHDEFGLGRSEFSLQAGEYVLYRLWKRGLRIRWTDARPRMPGMWHTILKGQQGIYMNIEPKVGTIMEYMIDGELGHVCYVEAVFPDDTVSVSEVNNPDSGIYNEREIPKSEWKEYKPVFIEVV